MDMAATRQKARKTYHCNSCEYIRDHVVEMGPAIPKEQAAIIDRLLTRHGGKIQPGELYIRTAGFDNGTVYTWRSGIEAHEFCVKHELYPED